MSVEYLDLADYLAVAAEVTGLEPDTLARVTRLSLADSALHAPDAGFGDVEIYPDFVDKAAVLLVRLTKNHPLPDGNKRAAWVSMRLFVAVNGWTWRRQPDLDDAETTVVAISAGELDEAGARGLAARVPRARNRRVTGHGVAASITTDRADRAAARRHRAAGYKGSSTQSRRFRRRAQPRMSCSAPDTAPKRRLYGFAALEALKQRTRGVFAQVTGLHRR